MDLRFVENTFHGKDKFSLKEKKECQIVKIVQVG